MYSLCKKSLSIFLLLSLGVLSSAYAADESKLNKSNKLFDFAEAAFPQFFSPSDETTFEFGDYWARYYSKTDTYIGTLGEEVYVYGTIFNGLLNVGKISDFITLNECSDNIPKSFCEHLIKASEKVGGDFYFESGASCNRAFPEYNYNPSHSDDFEGVCGLLECGACAGNWLELQ